MPATDILERHARRIAGKSWSVFRGPTKVGNVIAPTFVEADTKARRMYGSGAWVGNRPNN